ncbi:MAG TPA: iron-sulfur cluster assembly protein [Rubrobacter sp.]|nr:iron-sulfur cluster assembly protein [Rubrobacter sp.]
MPNRATVLEALSGVRDPELDEPITDLRFVSSLEIEDGAVNVSLRLPTYYCAPNFAYLMVADAREALLSVEGVEEARVVLDDHYASREINGGVNGERDFARSFPGQTEGDTLDELRDIFRRKSFVSRQEQLCRSLIREGRSPEELAGMRLAEARGDHAFAKYLERRSELGIDSSADAPLVVDPNGKRIPREAVMEHLRFASTVRMSIEGNAELCTGLLAVRYGTPDPEEAIS